MGKRQSSKATTDSNAARVKTSVWLDVEFMTALEMLAALRKMTQSDLIQSLLADGLARLPRRELDPIRAMVTNVTGKSLRLSGSSGASAPESTAPAEGQGIGSPVLNRIAKIEKTAVGDPVDAGLDILYQ